MGPGALKPRTRTRIGIRIVLLLGLLFLLIGLFYYRANLTSLNQRYTKAPRSGPVSLRSLPHPFRAALGLTLSPGPGLKQEQYVEALRYMISRTGPAPSAGTSQETGVGGGLGLEIGGAIFFYPPSEDWLAYFNPAGPEGDQTRLVYNSLIRAGIIDVLDSFGQDVRFSREMAEQALTALSRQGLTLTTWADRFKSPDNIDSSGGRGGHPNRMAYHLDLTLKAGFKYFWLGRSTSIVGQNTALDWETFRSLYDGKNVFSSSLGMVLTFGRHLAMVLAWSMDDVVRVNGLLAPVKLRNGSMGYEYVRYHPLGGKPTLEATLTERFLTRLIQTGGRTLVNLTLESDPDGRVFSPEERAALEALAQRQLAGELMVTNASRLLDLTALEQNLVWRAEEKGDRIRIVIEGFQDPLTGLRSPGLEELAGLTFYVPRSDRADLFLGDKQLRVSKNLIDHTGRESISLPWPELSFPELPRQEE